MRTALLALALATAQDGPPDLTVLEGDWGGAERADIRAVCLSAAEALLPHFPGRRLDPITVRASEEGPMVIFGRGDKGERRILLDVRGRQWDRFAYQFAHELGHILCGYRRGDRSNLWFEEAVCETASLFALRRMAETWKTRPPYANWKGYAPSLARYAEARIAAAPRPSSLPAWYRENEAALRSKPDDRPLNQVAAVALLDLLEKEPARWRSLGALNDARTEAPRSFAEFLRGWRDAAGEEDRPFVARVADLFGVPLD